MSSNAGLETHKLTRGNGEEETKRNSVVCLYRNQWQVKVPEGPRGKSFRDDDDVLHLPIQFLGPDPNGRYVQFLMFSLFSSLNLSGSNFSGSGK
jgi:hypothetical protein